MVAPDAVVWWLPSRSLMVAPASLAMMAPAAMSPGVVGEGDAGVSASVCQPGQDVELATLEWVHWWNNQRIHGYLNDVPPVEYEATWRTQQTQEAPARIQVTEPPKNPGRIISSSKSKAPPGHVGLDSAVWHVLQRFGALPFRQ